MNLFNVSGISIDGEFTGWLAQYWWTKINSKPIVLMHIEPQVNVSALLIHNHRSVQKSACMAECVGFGERV